MPPWLFGKAIRTRRSGSASTPTSPSWSGCGPRRATNGRSAGRLGGPHAAGDAPRLPAALGAGLRASRRGARPAGVPRAASPRRSRRWRARARETAVTMSDLYRPAHAHPRDDPVHPALSGDRGAGTGAAPGCAPETILADLDAVLLCGVPPYLPNDYIGVVLEGDKIYLSFAEHFRRPVNLTFEETLSLNLALQAAPARPARPAKRRSNFSGRCWRCCRAARGRNGARPGGNWRSARCRARFRTASRCSSRPSRSGARCTWNTTRPAATR